MRHIGHSGFKSTTIGNIIAFCDEVGKPWLWERGHTWNHQGIALKYGYGSTRDRKNSLAKMIKDAGEHAEALNFILHDNLDEPKLGCEVGVWRGNLSEYLLTAFPKLHLIMVDAWHPYYIGVKSRNWAITEQRNEMRKSLLESLDNTEILYDRRTVHIGDSKQVASTMRNECLDFVFIDADHRYEAVREDIKNWYSKVRPGGIVSGHDYGGKWDSNPSGWGVKKAVDEFVNKYGYALTVEKGNVWWFLKDMKEKKMKIHKSGAFSSGYQHAKNYMKRGRNVDQTLLDFVEKIVPKDQTIIDIGAGNGKYVMALHKLGYKASGIDGTKGIHKFTKGWVDETDLTENCSHLYGAVDWAIFLEVGEHIPKEFEQKIIDEVSRIPKRGLIVSWGNGRGFGHVNTQTPNYIVVEFAKRGWTINIGAMNKVRRIVSRDYRKRLKVFRKGRKRK